MRNDSFIFKGHEWDSAAGKATFFYEFLHNNESFAFTETLTFPQFPKSEAIPQELLKHILDDLLLILGISYYKLYCPRQLVLKTISLNKEQADFWNTVYTKGLGEFFYRNTIDFRGLISFSASENVNTSAIAFPRQERSLVGIGGGKDSIVAAELLKAHNKPFTAFVINTHPTKEKTSKLLGIETVLVRRKLDPLLLELNKKEDTYNGHVPVSAQLAFIGVFVALLYDYSYVVMANELSANYGNVSYLGVEINHQWSKSLEFELLFRSYIKTYLTADIEYFSLLRPYSEFAITKLFAKYKNFFPVFSSCNRNYKITGKTNKLWCGECPKCAFMFLMLAAFLPKEEVIAIFGKNLLKDQALVQTYKELLGLADIKPFDCVGTPDEVRAAFYLIMQRLEYKDTWMMRWFEKEVLPQLKDVDGLQEQLLKASSIDTIPSAFREVLP